MACLRPQALALLLLHVLAFGLALMATMPELCPLDLTPAPTFVPLGWTVSGRSVPQLFPREISTEPPSLRTAAGS